MYAQTPLVGRTEELRAISSLLERAEKGSGSALFVAGEGGVGKTRLLASAAERASKNGWKAAIGRAYPVESGVPYAVFSDALLPLLRNLDSSTMSVLSRGAVAELKSIFPTLENIQAAKSGNADDPSEFKARMLWTFSQFLGRLAQKQPLFLGLENLQWADASSLELFHFVARHADQQRVFLIGTYNDAERDANTVLKMTEESLRKIDAASSIQLSPLRPEEVTEIIQRTFGVAEPVIRKFSSQLYGRTRGNPFFTEEILKALTSSGRLTMATGGWEGWDAGNLDLPSTVRDAVGARLARLSERARELAACCAVLGTRPTFDILANLSSLSPDDLVACIEELCSLKILDEIPGGHAEYDFAHPLLQQVLYSEIGAARANLLHGSIAASLEKMYGSRSDEHADELAFHYSRAQGSDTTPKAIRYLHLAGAKALSRYANREAETYLKAALDRLDRGGDSIPADERLTIIASLARALQRNGSYGEAIDLWTRARDDAKNLGDDLMAATAEHRMGLATYWSASYGSALEHFDSALETAASLQAESQMVRIHLARAIALQDLGKVELAKAGVEEALAVAEKNGDEKLLARVHRALLLLYAWTGPKEKAREHGRKAIEYSEASGQKMLEWTAHWGMSVLCGLSSDADGMAQHLAIAEQLSEQLGSPILPIWTSEISVQYLSGVGDWETGIAKGEHAITMARSFGQKSLLPRLLVWTGLIHLWRGDFEKSKKYIDEAWSLSRAGNPRREGDIPSIVPAHHGMASYHLHTRNFGEAIRVGEAGLAIADAAGYAAWALQWLLPVVGESALWAKDFDRAEKHSRRMRADAARLDHPLGLAWADACDGLIITQRDGNPAAGLPLLRSAAEKMDELQIPGSAALLRRHLGRELIDSGDRESARNELRRAHDVLARLGARSELEAVRGELRKLVTRLPAKSQMTGAEGLTGRELEISRMVADRKTNKEIGAALDISARTVSTHLSNIFVKLGVESRGALTDRVREKGLAET